MVGPLLMAGAAIGLLWLAKDKILSSAAVQRNQTVTGAVSAAQQKVPPSGAVTSGVPVMSQAIVEPKKKALFDPTTIRQALVGETRATLTTAKLRELFPASFRGGATLIAGSVLRDPEKYIQLEGRFAAKQELSNIVRQRQQAIAPLETQLRNLDQQLRAVQLSGYDPNKTRPAQMLLREQLQKQIDVVLAQFRTREQEARALVQRYR